MVMVVEKVSYSSTQVIEPCGSKKTLVDLSVPDEQTRTTWIINDHSFVT